MYFVMRTAIARMGGATTAAQRLGVHRDAVAAWVQPLRRARPEDAVLAQISEHSGIALESLELYYRNLETYRKNESFRRRRK